MILILTGGTENSREILKKEIKMLESLKDNIEILESPHYNQLRSKIELNIRTQTHKLIIGCFMKSQRYEIFCIARRFNVPYFIIVDVSPCEHDFYEEPNPIHKYEKNLIMSYKLSKINEEFVNTKHKTNKVKGFWCHKNKGAPSSDYLTKSKEIIDKVNLDYKKFGFVLSTCEERIYNMIDRNPIEMEEIEKTYRKIINDMIHQKNI